MQAAFPKALDELFGIHGRHRLERRHDHEGRAHIPD